MKIETIPQWKYLGFSSLVSCVLSGRNPLGFGVAGLSVVNFALVFALKSKIAIKLHPGVAVGLGGFNIGITLRAAYECDLDIRVQVCR